MALQAVPIVSTPPTPIDVRVVGGICEGHCCALWPRWNPVFPAAATTVIPALEACSASGGSSEGIDRVGLDSRVRPVREGLITQDVESRVVCVLDDPVDQRRSPEGDIHLAVAYSWNLDADDPRVRCDSQMSGRRRGAAESRSGESEGSWPAIRPATEEVPWPWASRIPEARGLGREREIRAVDRPLPEACSARDVGVTAGVDHGNVDYCPAGIPGVPLHAAAPICERSSWPSSSQRRSRGRIPTLAASPKAS